MLARRTVGSAAMTRALVLGGGGAVGIAWELGLLAGLATGGVDVREADTVIGTSAGSAVGAMLRLRPSVDEAVERYRDVNQAPAAGAAPAASAGPSIVERMTQLMEFMLAPPPTDRTPEEHRAELGKLALDADTIPEDQFVGRFTRMFDWNGGAWPEGFRCTTIDATTGEFVVWSADSDVDLHRAVASSCAVPMLFPPITINGRRYYDGGLRSPSNADLAEGHDRVLVVSVLSMDGPMAGANPNAGPGQRLKEEVEALTAGGSVVEVVAPDAAGAKTMGLNLMDPSVIPAVISEALRQGESEAPNLAAFWSQR